MPFSFIAKKFFVLPNVLQKNMKELELSNNKITYLVNGKVWNVTSEFQSTLENILPVFFVKETHTVQQQSDVRSFN